MLIPLRMILAVLLSIALAVPGVIAVIEQLLYPIGAPGMESLSPVFLAIFL